MNKLIDLRCLICHKDPTLEDILIFKIDNDNWIKSSLCIRCSKKTLNKSLQKQGWFFVAEFRYLIFDAEHE